MCRTWRLPTLVYKIECEERCPEKWGEIVDTTPKMGACATSGYLVGVGAEENARADDKRQLWTAPKGKEQNQPRFQKNPQFFLAPMARARNVGSRQSLPLAFLIPPKMVITVMSFSRHWHRSAQAADWARILFLFIQLRLLYSTVHLFCRTRKNSFPVCTVCMYRYYCNLLLMRQCIINKVISQ